MAYLTTWIGALLMVAGSGLCSYSSILNQFDVKPPPRKNNNDTQEFQRTLIHLADGLECIYPTDCADVQECGRTKSGVYRVFPYGLGDGFLVYCDMTSAGGGWLVFQRRQDGSVDFFRNWQNYTDGFGNLVGEFWLGLDKIHLLTSQREYELLVNLGSYDNGSRYARYGRFFVSDHTGNYRLLLGSYSGTAGDSMAYHNGLEFSTQDRDNDNHNTRNCAKYYHGCWWYNGCHYVHLNGEYYHRHQKAIKNDNAISWYYWTKSHKPLQTAEMKVRPVKAG